MEGVIHSFVSKVDNTHSALFIDRQLYWHFLVHYMTIRVTSLEQLILAEFSRELGPEYVEKFFSHSLKFLNDFQKKLFGTWQYFRIQKWSFAKLPSFSFCHFLWWEVFVFWEQEKIFSTYFRLIGKAEGLWKWP